MQLILVVLAVSSKRRPQHGGPGLAPAETGPACEPLPSDDDPPVMLCSGFCSEQAARDHCLHCACQLCTFCDAEPQLALRDGRKGSCAPFCSSSFLKDHCSLSECSQCDFCQTFQSERRPCTPHDHKDSDSEACMNWCDFTIESHCQVPARMHAVS
jgi:hypothetical protein